MKTISCAIMGGRLADIPFFTNKRDKRTIKIKNRIFVEMLKLILNEGVTYFMSGMELGAELYAAELVSKFKRDFPDLKLECVFPHEQQASDWPEYHRYFYYETASHCDKETFITRRYTPDCYDMRDRYLISNADFILLITAEEIILVKLIED